MIDLHCHILPGVDDGPRTLDETLAIARFCQQDGITHIVATPHCHRRLHLLRSDILPHVRRVNEALQREGIDVTVLPGSEIRLTDVGDYRDHYERGLYCHLGDDRRFTLLEFEWRKGLYPHNAPKHVRWLRQRDTIPIIAHPERHGFFRSEPPRLRALVEAGAWLQITVDSLLGNHGSEAQVASEYLLRLYPDAVLATDTHNLQRCSGLSLGYQWVRENLGTERADDLLARSTSVLEHLLKFTV